MFMGNSMQINCLQSICSDCLKQYSHLQTQMVPRDVLLQLGRLGRIEFHGELQHPHVGFEELGDGTREVEPHTLVDRCRV